MNSTVNRIENAELAAEHALRQQRLFAANASHELLTPVAGIRAQLELARLYPDDLRDAVEGALRATCRLEAIVADLLLLAGIETIPDGRREEIDFGQLVASEVGWRRGRRPIRVDIPAGVTVRGMRSLLSRVVTSLLDNADRHAATTVRVDVRCEDGWALLAVTNDGEAIPEAEHERIFDRFYRRDAARSRSNGGSGLGLAIVREVVEAHGGRIGVEDAKPGVRFVVRLPMASSNSAVRSQAEGAVPGRSPDLPETNPPPTPSRSQEDGELVTAGRSRAQENGGMVTAGRSRAQEDGEMVTTVRFRVQEGDEAGSPCRWDRAVACSPPRPSGRSPKTRSGCGS